MNDVVAYYDRLAPDYDATRFGHSWGQFLDRQEREVLEGWLPDSCGSDVLDLACGSGRMLDLATRGVDASPAMVDVASQQRAETVVDCAEAHALPYPDDSFDAVFSLHLVMHLELSYVRRILTECHRILRPDGLLIFDAPSELRRNINGYASDDWHCATALHPLEVRRQAAPLFDLIDFRGVLFAPLHRLPDDVRQIWRPIDSAIGQTSLGRWACTHLLYLLQSTKT